MDTQNTSSAPSPTQDDDEVPVPVRPLPPELESVVSGDGLTNGQERSALDWLLGATRALEYDCPVDYETPDGIQELTFHFSQQDPATLERIDAGNRKGDGPFAKLDKTAFAQEVVSTATHWIGDRSGRRVEIRSTEFLGGVPSPQIALALRFKFQGGLLEGLAEEVQKVSGYSADRVGTAQRAVVEAGKPS